MNSLELSEQFFMLGISLPESEINDLRFGQSLINNMQSLIRQHVDQTGPPSYQLIFLDSQNDND